MKCRDPLANSYEMRKSGFDNIGLRTAGDGEINGTKAELLMNLPTSETLLNIRSLKDQASEDHKFLEEESQYLQSIAS